MHTLHVLRWTLCSCIWCGDERLRDEAQVTAIHPGKERTESVQMAARVQEL